MWSLSKYELLTEYCKLRNCYGVLIEERGELEDASDEVYHKVHKDLLGVLLNRFPIEHAYRLHIAAVFQRIILTDEEKEMDEIFSAMCDPSVKAYFFTVTCGPNGGLDES